MAETAPIILWQSPPCWGMPSTSPFCIKVEAWLRMAGLAYEARVIQGLPRSPTRKIPYVELADGRLIADSGVIIETLAAERGVDLDAGLDPRARGLATAITRLLEDHLYWAIAWDRWVPPAHWARTRVAYFGYLPGPLPWLVPPIARRGVRKALFGQGFGRMGEAAIVARAERDLAAVAALLGDEEHPLGRPAVVDATLYAFLVALLRPPFDGPLQRAAAAHPNLVAYCERFERRWLAGPAPAAK
ncbi:MAG: glutathione S-transferase family protein [Myxococcales bacterium]|nr:glutathione S-transferase family protein [Myxococcales bacterium]MCB9702803.1 glutathione S-transferase family protein [Myxococcales bacterium]